jgi:transposase-like protein
MNERERKEQVGLPACPNPDCRESRVVRNGSHRGRQRYCCRSCHTYFGETQGTPMYGLKTPAAEVAQALLIVMRRGSLRAAEEITGHTYETISVWLKRAAAHATALTPVLASDLHLSQVEIDECWSFVQKKTRRCNSKVPSHMVNSWREQGSMLFLKRGVPCANPNNAERTPRRHDEAFSVRS